MNGNTKNVYVNEIESNVRERRKVTRKFYSNIKKNSDDGGTLTAGDKDVCDCLMDDCPGCHFPCPKCRSCKCGPECRVNRKWMYEGIENESEMLTARKDNV